MFNIIKFAQKYVPEVQAIDDPALHTFLSERLESSYVYMEDGYLFVGVVVCSLSSDELDPVVLHVKFDRNGGVFHSEDSGLPPAVKYVYDTKDFLVCVQDQGWLNKVPDVVLDFMNDFGYKAHLLNSRSLQVDADGNCLIAEIQVSQNFGGFSILGLREKLWSDLNGDDSWTPYISDGA